MIAVHTLTHRLLAALELAAPHALWLLLLAVPVALLHLYHRRKVIVPFLPLLVEASGPRRPGGGWRRLRDVLPLALRVLSLLCVVLALAGLAPARRGPPPEALVLVVDAGLSTRTLEPDGRSRYAHGIELARASIASAAWAEVSVLEARATPHVLVPPTTDAEGAEFRLGQLLADVAAGRLEASDRPADLDAAVAQARALAASRPVARVRVFSAAALEVPDAPQAIEVWGTGVANDDQGIVAFEMGRVVEGGVTTLRVGIRNRAETASARDLILLVDGEETARQPLALEAGATEEIVAAVQAPADGGWLEVRLDGDDVFAVNDRVEARLAPARRPSVLVVHGGVLRPWTSAVVDALEGAIDVKASGSVHAADLVRAPAFDVYLVDGVALPDGALRKGAWIFLAPLGGDLPFEVGAPVKEPLVWRTSPEHELVRDVDLGSAWVARGYPVSGTGLVPLAEADGQAVLAEGEQAGVRYVVLGLDPDASDLPLRVAWPLLVRGAMRRLTTAPTEPLEPFVRAGTTLRPTRPLPGGPEALIRWAGREEQVRLAPDRPGWPVPEGVSGRVVVETQGPHDTWRGRTAFVALHPNLDVSPVRPAASMPARFIAVPDATRRWRRALLVTAGLLLLLDLLVLGWARRARRKLVVAHSSV